MTPPTPDFIRLVASALSRDHKDDEVAADSVLTEIGFDSFGKVQLLIAIQSALDIEIPETDLTRENFETITTLWAIVAPHIRPPTPSVDESG